MKRLFLGAALAVLAALPALADDPMANTYANTVVATSADGKVTKSHYNADKSYETTGQDGTTSKGTWELAEGDTKICVTQTEPAPPPDAKQPACAPFLGARNPGDKWEQAGFDGQNVTVELVAGR